MESGRPFIETLHELPPAGIRDLLTLSRGLGVGRQLMTQVIDSAGDRFDTLRLRTSNEAAVRLYVAMGFRAFTGAGECTHILELARRSG